jgi:hypothetical protein
MSALSLAEYDVDEAKARRQRQQRSSGCVSA